MHAVQTVNTIQLCVCHTSDHKSFTKEKSVQRQTKCDCCCCSLTHLSLVKGLSVISGGSCCAPSWGLRKVASVLFLCLLAVIRSHCCHAAVAPIITPTLSGVWVDGCADLSVPCSSFTVRTVAATFHYTHIQLFEQTLMLGGGKELLIISTSFQKFLKAIDQFLLL